MVEKKVIHPTSARFDDDELKQIQDFAAKEKRKKTEAIRFLTMKALELKAEGRW